MCSACMGRQSTKHVCCKKFNIPFFPLCPVPNRRFHINQRLQMSM